MRQKKNKKFKMQQGQGSVLIKKWYFGSVGLFLILSAILAGCTLAQPSLQQPEEEQLCGILVVVGEQEAQRHHEKEMEGRTFSSIKELEESLTAFPMAEGTLHSDGTITFEGMEGHTLGIIEEGIGNHSTTHFINDGYFTKVKANTNVTDEGTENIISGSILAMEDLKEPIYMYPVYGRSDGSYYTTLNSSGGMMCNAYCEGELYSQTLHWDTTEEINGRVEKNSRELKVSLEIARPIEHVQVRIYSDKNELLETKEISRGIEEVTLQEGTAYVIVEEAKTDGGLQRSLYNWEEVQEGLEHCVYYPDDSGLIKPETITFIKD